MSLDVWLVRPIKGGANSSRKHIASFSWDAEFEFLTPFWPRLTTGGAVDLYGDARFRGPQLTLLRQALESAHRALANKPHEWQERIGWTSPDRTEPIYDTASKASANQKITALLDAITMAEESGGVIEFVGD